MDKNIKILLCMMIVFTIVAGICNIALISATDIPRIEPYVNDFAGLLSQQDELKLNLLADQIENRTTFEIAIVTVQGTGGQDRLEFANEIGDLNGVGKKDSDNGLVVLWSVDDDQGGAIATGRGSESFITDSTTGTIGRAARPYFDRGDFYGGMNYIVTELDKAIVKHQAIPIGGNITDTSGEGDDGFNAVMIWMLFGGLAIIIFKLATSFTRSDNDSSDYYCDSSDDKGYYRKQVYKRHGNWYNKEADRSYLTAAAAAAALATMNTDSDSDSDSDDDSSSSSSSGGFSGGSFGGGGFGGGGGKF